MHMGQEDLAQRMPIMIIRALAIDLTCDRIEKSEQVGGAVSVIVKVLKSRLMSRCRQGGRHTLEGLNAGAFIETIEILWRVGITLDDMLHLGKKIRISDLQVVFAAMGSKRVLQ